MIRYNVNFANQHNDIYVDHKTTVASACSNAGYNINSTCSGKGICGKCLVKIDVDHVVKDVLACRTLIESDIIIYLDESDYIHNTNILVDNFDSSKIKFNPSVNKIYSSKEDLITHHNDFYLENGQLYVLTKFADYINDPAINGITFVKYKDEIIDIQAEDTSKYLYGAAIDIGTTSVVIYIYDLVSGEILKTYPNLNMQISYGADVISRISFCQSSDSALCELHEKIIATINLMLTTAQNEFENFSAHLYNIVLCGNSVMQHLFLKLNPSSLGSSPFVNIVKNRVECFGGELKLLCNERCKVIFLPLIGGFVGADTTSVLLTIENSNKNILMIDLGTNGEIAVGNINKYVTASAACGPALEGGNIECGMTGRVGAIDKFVINDADDIEYSVIGDVSSKGICGSGIIDIVYALLKKKIIDKTGRLLSRDEYALLYQGSKLLNRLEKFNNLNCFVICPEDKKIYISQKDIRNIQLAKSSIYSAAVSLVNKYCDGIKNIDELIISGAFGNYIDIKKAIYIGLLPDISMQNIKSIGNGAGKGIQLYLLDKEMESKCDEIIQNAIHCELGSDSEFMNLYITNMNFKQI